MPCPHGHARDPGERPYMSMEPCEARREIERMERCKSPQERGGAKPSEWLGMTL